MDDLLNDLIIYFEANNVGNATNEFLNRCKKAQTEQCAINGVVGRSEQLVCSCDNPNGFKEMEEGRETCSKCKKPY